MGFFSNNTAILLIDCFFNSKGTSTVSLSINENLDLSKETIGLFVLINIVSFKFKSPLTLDDTDKESIFFFLKNTVTVSLKFSLFTIKFNESLSIGVYQ